MRCFSGVFGVSEEWLCALYIRLPVRPCNLLTKCYAIVKTNPRIWTVKTSHQHKSQILCELLHRREMKENYEGGGKKVQAWPGFRRVICKKIGVSHCICARFIWCQKERKENLRRQWHNLRKRSHFGTEYRKAPPPRKGKENQWGSRGLRAWPETGSWWELITVLERARLV